jgi:hypothetical protein
MDQKNENNCSGWDAWQNNQPMSKPTLYVIGKCTFPTAGYSVDLKITNPQGINPKILMLDKVIHKPKGPVIQVPTTVEARFELDTVGKHQYTQVSVEGVGTIPIREVH